MIEIRIISRVAVMVGAAFLSINAARAADPYNAIERDIRHEMAAGRATGLAVALVRHGKIVWQQGFGWADKARKRRATPDTPFSLASITKPFTTTALMELVASGKVSLDARANDYLGAAKIRAGDPDAMTVRRLASHSSGLPPTFQILAVRDKLKPPSMDEVIRDYAVPVVPPSRRFLYPDAGMGIVGHIVARVSGEDLGRFLREHVLQPLGLHHSFFDTDVSRRDEMAERYDDEGNPFPFYVTSTPGTGELYASAHDMARFAMFHLKDHLTDQQAILSDGQIDELHRPVIPTLGDRSYDLGWMTGHAYDGTPVIYHNGEQAGVVTVMTLWPSRDVAVLSNHEGDDALVSRVRDAALRTPVPKWTWRTLSPPPPKPLPAGYLGTWQGRLHYRDRAIPLLLSIGKKNSTLQIGDQQPGPIPDAALVQGMMVGETRGNLDLPVTRAIGAKNISLSLRLRGSKLEGEIGAEAPIPHARSPQHLPFRAEFSKVDAVKARPQGAMLTKVHSDPGFSFPAGAVAARPLTIERLYRLPWVIGTHPEDPQWSPDSRHLAFLWNDEGTNFRDVWMTNVATGKPVRVTAMPRPENPANPGADIARLEQVERAENDRGVSSVIWAPDGRHLVFVLHGRLYRVLPGHPPQALTEVEPSASDIAASARAHEIAYLASGDLRIVDFSASKPESRAIYSPDRRDVAVESFVWSGDGKRIAFVEADASQVPTRGIPDYLGESTRLVEVKRPFPGEPSPLRRLGVVAATGGAIRWMDLGKNALDPIFSVRWSPDGKHLLVDKSDLYIKDRRLLILDPDSGQSRLLLRETDPRNVTAEWWADWAPDGKGVYFTSDRDNDYQLYLQALAGGDPEPVTAGNWAVFSASISPAAHALFVVTNEGSAESRRVYRVPLAGGDAQAITPAEGAHAPLVSPDGRHLADLYSNDVTPPDLYLQNTSSARAAATSRRQITHSPLREFGDYHWVAPKYVVFKNVNDGTPLHARLTLPPNFDPAKKYPAILGSVYSNTVHNEWGGRVYHPTWGLDQFLAQQGYVIMNVDISGSSGHGKAFRQRIREDYGGVDVDDLYSGTRYLIAQWHVDPGRIGIWGSSYGGLLTAMSMFRYPDAYRAGVAGAPATSLFHALTGEMQTMMAPQGHEAQYAKSSAFLRSGDLKGHLMLIHGMRDTTVLFKDSVTLVERLILQGQDVDLVVLPNAPHGWDTEGLAQTRYAYRKLYDYFDRYLGTAAQNRGQSALLPTDPAGIR